MKVRIVLLPDKNFEEEAKKASALISSKVPTHFKLDENHIPHTTITDLEFEDKHLEEIIKITEKYADSQQIEVKTNEVKIDEQTFIGVYFQDDTLVRKRREEIIQSLAEYNQGNPVLRQPHLTFTRVISENNALRALTLTKDFPRKNYYLNSLAICKDGPNGTCLEIMSKFALKE